MEPKDVMAIVFFLPLAGIWVCTALWFCAFLLRMAWDSIRGEL